MEYPHWLMVAGAVLVVVGFIGLAFHQNRTVEPDLVELDGEATDEESVDPGAFPPART